MNNSISNYESILTNIKEKIKRARVNANIALNASMLNIYWEIGNFILSQQGNEGWGSKVVERLAKDLKSEFPDMKGFSSRNLKYMRAFAEAYPQFGSHNEPFKFVQGSLAQINEKDSNELMQELLAQITWYHHITLINKVKDIKTRFFYIEETVKNGWSRDIMVHQIESGLHNRQGQITSNFSKTIVPPESELVQQIFKDPYKFDFISLGKEAKERDLENALIDQLTKFLLELGQYFSFMGRRIQAVSRPGSL